MKQQFRSKIRQNLNTDSVVVSKIQMEVLELSRRSRRWRRRTMKKGISDLAYG